MLATRKMKKTTVCTRWRRFASVRSSGQISSMLAPVVPTALAIAVPIARNVVLTSGVGRKSPRIAMPPLIT